jgi:pilus assembly protein Flp/PilA
MKLLRLFLQVLMAPDMRTAFRRGSRGQQATMGSFMREIIKSYVSDESGAAAAEYALILTIIGGVLLAAVGTLGTDIATALTKAGTVIAAYKFS